MPVVSAISGLVAEVNRDILSKQESAETQAEVFLVCSHSQYNITLHSTVNNQLINKQLVQSTMLIHKTPDKSKQWVHARVVRFCLYCIRKKNHIIKNTKSKFISELLETTHCFVFKTYSQTTSHDLLMKTMTCSILSILISWFLV